MSELSGASTNMLLNILRMCTDAHVQRGFEPAYVRVVREAVEEALATDRDKPKPAYGSQCRTMPHQRPCGYPSCTRVDCNSDPVVREAARLYGPDLVPYVLKRYEEQREQD